MQPNGIVELLDTLFCWPFVVCVIALVFMFKFSDTIRYYIKHNATIKIGPVTIETNCVKKQKKVHH